jgi:hypothetical protein
VERSGEARHLPELYRLEGECLLRGGAGWNESIRREILRCFDQALALARRQGARLWGLRAAISTAARPGSALARPGRAARRRDPPVRRGLGSARWTSSPRPASGALSVG